MLHLDVELGELQGRLVEVDTAVTMLYEAVWENNGDQAMADVLMHMVRARAEIAGALRDATTRVPWWCMKCLDHDVQIGVITQVSHPVRELRRWAPIGERGTIISTRGEVRIAMHKDGYEVSLTWQQVRDGAIDMALVDVDLTEGKPRRARAHVIDAE